jgi:hypothetical protein
LILAPRSLGTLELVDDANTLSVDFRKRSNDSNWFLARITPRGGSHADNRGQVQTLRCLKAARIKCVLAARVKRRKTLRRAAPRESGKATRFARNTLKRLRGDCMQLPRATAHERNALAVFRAIGRWRSHSCETRETLGKDEAHGSMRRVCGVKSAGPATASMKG